MKKYSAIFFDWDGTAVISRKAPADEACAAMKPLLAQGTPLVIISGTTYENLAGGRLESFFTPAELQNLYLGLGRGAYQYAYTPEGEPHVFANCLPDKEHLLLIHQICFDIHQYLQGNELAALKHKLSYHQITGGLQSLLDLAKRMGEEKGLKVLSTCDAKYLEVGISSKADNADLLMKRLMEDGIAPENCAFFGDEYVGIEKGIFGSDSFMKTELTSAADFFDVSEVEGERPEGVQVLGGGVNTFLHFLKEQAGL